MKKIILSLLLITSSMAYATHPVIESLQKHPGIIIASIGFIFNLDKRYVKPNYYGGLTSSFIFMVHRVLGGRSSGELNACSYGVGGMLGKMASRPVHNFINGCKQKISYIWNNV